MASNQYSRRLNTVAVKHGQIVPERPLVENVQALYASLVRHSASVLAATSLANAGNTDLLDNTAVVLAQLADLVCDCFLLAALVGSDLDSVLEGAVNTREHDRQSTPPPPQVPPGEQAPSGQYAPTAADVQAGFPPAVVYARGGNA